MTLDYHYNEAEDTHTFYFKDLYEFERGEIADRAIALRFVEIILSRKGEILLEITDDQEAVLILMYFMDKLKTEEET